MPNASAQPPQVPGAVEALTPSERGMLRTVLWQRDEAVPGYVEIEYDAALWDRIALDMQRREKLMLSPLLPLMAYRLVTLVRDTAKINATLVDGQLYRSREVNLGFTVQAGETLYLVVARNASVDGRGRLRLDARRAAAPRDWQETAAGRE